MVRFTIGIPVRNGERYLEEAIASAVTQSRPANEILVVDDASTDGSAAIAQSSRWGNRVRYVFNDRATGFADAFNRMAHLAEGSHLVVLCADDLLDAECLAALESGLLRFPSAGLCYTGFRYINEHGETTATSDIPHSLGGVLYSGSRYSFLYLAAVQSGRHLHRCVGFAVDRRIMRDQCPFRSEAGLIADDDFFVRIGAFTDVVGISQPLASVRSHSGALSSRLDSLSLRLATDYLFQVRALAKAPHGCGAPNREMYHDLATRFLDLLFKESLQRGRGDLLMQAIALQREFDTLAPEARLKGASSPWQAVLRHAVSHPRSTWLFERALSGLGHTLRTVRSHFKNTGGAS
jgi:hypothetical protein